MRQDCITGRYLAGYQQPDISTGCGKKVSVNEGLFPKNSEMTGLANDRFTPRESKRPPPHHASCERRSRRSRPTIYCWIALLLQALSYFCFQRLHINVAVEKLVTTKL